MRFKPDWSEVWTAAKAEAELTEFKFTGPGFYRHNGDTILAIPLGRPASQLWHQAFRDDEEFEFNVYNGRDPADWFNLIANAPTRFPYDTPTAPPPAPAFDPKATLAAVVGSDPMTIARALKTCKDAGFIVKEIADVAVLSGLFTDKAHEHVRQHLMLLRLPPVDQDRVKARTLGMVAAMGKLKKYK